MAPSSQLLRQPKQRIQQSRAASVRVNALFVSRSKTAVKEPAAETKAEETKKQVPRESGLSSVVNALDFAAPRSKKDAEILYETKTNWKKGETKMTREQYGALRRKIGGTYKDFFKGYVEEERVENTYYKPDNSGGSVPYLPVLIGIVVAMLGTTVLVVAQTSN